MADACCPTAGVVETGHSHQPGLLGCCCVSQVPFNVQSGQSFVRLELVKLNVGTSTLEKLTAAPASTDQLAFVVYDVTNTVAAVAAGTATAKAQVYIDGTFNELAITLPAGVTADQVRAQLAVQGFVIKKPILA